MFFAKIRRLCGTLMGGSWWCVRVLLVTAGAFLLSLVLEPFIEPDFSPLFLGAIALCTWGWGVRAGVLSTALSAASMLYLFFPLALLSWSVFFRELSFIATASLIVWLVKNFTAAHSGLMRSLEAIQAREELFRIALRNSPVMVFHQDAALRYLWVYNPFPEHRSVSLLHKVDADLFPPVEAAQLTQLKWGVLATGRGARQEVTLTSQGQPRIMDLMVEPFRNAAGQVVGILGTAVDVTDRKHNEERLRQSRQQLRGLAARLQAAREQERALTSRELHDLAQLLTALELQLSVMTTRISEGAEPGAVAERLKAVTELLASTIESSARLSAELRPSLLDNMGLAAALEWHAHEFASRTGIPVVSELAEGTRMDPKVAMAVFRIFEQTLANVEQHAQASEIHLSLRQEGRNLVLEVRDNGRGISAAGEIASTGSLGILGMRERALSFGGRIDIRGTPGEGTTVTLEIPDEARISDGVSGTD